MNDQEGESPAQRYEEFILHLADELAEPNASLVDDLKAEMRMRFAVVVAVSNKLMEVRIRPAHCHL